MHTSETFGLQFSNIPVVNLRLEFVETYRNALELLRRETGCSHFHNICTDVLELDAELNHSMRICIMSMESYINYAVWDILGATKAWTPEKRLLFKNPYGHKKGICGAYYDVLPSLIEPKLSLRLTDNTL